MPREINLSVPQNYELSEVRLQAPVNGDREMTKEERSRLLDLAPLCNFYSQFTFENPGEIYIEAKNPASVVHAGDAAHSWLSENSTGPWHWCEGWTNQGHSLQADVFIERLSDQKAFLDKFQKSCRYTANDAEQLDQLAVLRGVLPNLSTKESVFAWEEANRGFELQRLGEYNCSLTFTIPDLESKFVTDWGHLFKKLSIEGQQNTYVGPMPDVLTRGTLGSWLYIDHAVLGSPKFVREVSGNAAFSLTVSHPSAIEAFRGDLGDLITRDAGNGTFILHELKIPPRQIPADFMAYLRGEREDYKRPYFQC
jgi:hypothetical protein